MELSPLTAAIGSRIILRICWQDGSEHRRHGRDEILSVRVHAIHVRVDIEHDQPDSTYLQCHKPNYYHCCTCPHCIFYSSDLWLYQKRFSLSQCVRAQGCTDLYLTSYRIHRTHVVPLAPALTQRASVRKHVGWTYHASGFRRFHRSVRHRIWRYRLDWRRTATLNGYFALCAGDAGCVFAGLRIRHTDVNLSQRRHSSRSLLSPLSSIAKGP